MMHLTQAQRYEIFAYQASGLSQSQIAVKLDKDKSVISRELGRNTDPSTGKYSPEFAQANYKARLASKPKSISFTAEIQERVTSYLLMDYSPEQIVGTCEREGLACVSVERIYQFVWGDKATGGTLHKHLRRNGRKYRKRGSLKDSRGIIKGRVGIEERPAVVDTRERFGDLEIDTVIGKNHKGALLTINDRQSGYLWCKLLPNREASTVLAAAVELLLPIKERLCTITADNGKEFALHKDIAEKLGIAFYFARPYHSWERGSNENLNGLIRQYVPKGTAFDDIDQNYITHITEKLNNRPRKRLGFYAPGEVALVS